MLEKLIALKENNSSLKNKMKILALIGALIIILGGIIISIPYLSTSNNKGVCAGGDCVATTTQNTLLKPDWGSKTRDICGDSLCGITEEAGQNMCPKDCINRPLAIDNFIATPSVVAPGQTAVLSWSSTASFCASSGSDDAWFVTGGAASGSVSTTPLEVSKTYTISCMNNSGEIQTKDITVMVASPTAQPIAKKLPPTITFTATPSAIDEGQSTTLFWVAANATSCTASLGASWGWTGARGTKGTQVTPALTKDESYALTCSGAGGRTTKSTKVVMRRKTDDGTPVVDSVDNPPSSSGTAPSIIFRTSPTTVSSGETTTIFWYGTGAASCVAGGDGSSLGWEGSILTNGTKTTSPLNEDQTFAITCTSAKGVSSTKNATVKVTHSLQAEKRDCLLNGVTIYSGGDITLYKDAVVKPGSGIVCSSEIRHCEDGTLKGSYTNGSCSLQTSMKTTCGTWDGITPIATFQGLEKCSDDSCRWYGEIQSGDLYKCRAILDRMTNTWACKSLEKVNTGGRGCF